DREPRSGPSRRLCANQGPGARRLRDQRARRDGGALSVVAAGRGEARGAQIAPQVCIPDGLRHAGPRGAARRALPRGQRRSRRARSAVCRVRERDAGRGASRSASLSRSRAAHARRAARAVMTARLARRAADVDVRLPVPGDPTVSFSISFGVGSQNDPPGKEGLAYLTGLMLAEAGTKRRSYEQILEELYPLASDYSVRVDKERTTLTGRTHRDNLDRYVPLLIDAYLEPAFDARDFERLKCDAINDIENTLRYAEDEELAKAALYAFVFAGTRYAHPPEGTVRGLENVTLDDVRAFYRAHYTRDN